MGWVDPRVALVWSGWVEILQFSMGFFALGWVEYDKSAIFLMITVRYGNFPAGGPLMSLT